VAISEQAIAELSDKCGRSAAECRAFLAQHGADVEATLAALIDSGRIKTDDLNPETVSDALFDRAALRDKIELYRGIIAKGQGPMWDIPPGMTAEQKAVAEAAKRAERVKELQAAGQPFITAADQARTRVRSNRRSTWLDAHPFTLTLPPFPPLKMTLNDWEGRDVLPTWAGTQARHGAYTSVSSDDPSDGSFELCIPRLCRDDRKPKPPAPEQVAAYAYLKEHEAVVTESVLAAILVMYRKLRPAWLEQMPDADDLPEIQSTDELKQHVGLGTLHMFDIAKDNYAYLGLELGCTWDEEHGVGVILHGGRVVEVGQADTSFNPHPAFVDGGTRLSGKP
jgi:hypothetical protein